MPFVRARLSRVLNAVFGRGLSFGVRDMSSGLRLYRADAIRGAWARCPRGSTCCRRSSSRPTPRAGGSSRCRSCYVAGPARAVACARLALRRRLRSHVLAAVEAAQLDRVRRLRRPRPRQRHPPAALLAALASPPRHRAGGRPGSRARRRLRIEPDHRCAAAGQRRRGHPAAQAALRRAASAGRWCRRRGSTCRSPMRAFRACCVRR